MHAYAYSSLIDCFEGTPYSENQSCTLTGTNVSCSAYASGGFGNSCYFYGFASIHCPALNNLFLSQSANQTTCQCTC